MSPLAVDLSPILAAALHPTGQPDSQPPYTAALTPDVTDPVLQTTTVQSEQSTETSDSRSLQEANFFLLVDDNNINLKILSSYAKKIGRPYTMAKNGVEAVEAFCRNPGQYKCVFMDISMLIKDGFEATRRIRAYEREEGLDPVAIFALSGLASSSVQQGALESGIDLFLTKPVKLQMVSCIMSISKAHFDISFPTVSDSVRAISSIIRQ